MELRYGQVLGTEQLLPDAVQLFKRDPLSIMAFVVMLDLWFVEDLTSLQFLHAVCTRLLHLMKLPTGHFRRAAEPTADVYSHFGLFSTWRILWQVLSGATEGAELPKLCWFVRQVRLRLFPNRPVDLPFTY
jgi:hypothetical protein